MKMRTDSPLELGGEGKKWVLGLLLGQRRVCKGSGMTNILDVLIIKGHKND